MGFRASRGPGPQGLGWSEPLFVVTTRPAAFQGWTFLLQSVELETQTVSNVVRTTFQ